MILKDKVAIVTGASRGIGEAIARKFCKEGASVMLCSRSAESVAAIVESLSREGGNAKSTQADISNKADVEALVDLTLKEFARVDILVNNAGITRDTLFMRMKDEDLGCGFTNQSHRNGVLHACSYSFDDAAEKWTHY